jgi:very-short-patch-repair endonuclease
VTRRIGRDSKAKMGAGSIKTTFARELRSKQTEAEKALWARLKSKQLDGAKFRRQQVIGRYIVDFANLESKVVIELDGGHHNEDKSVVYDEERAAWLSGEGYRVLRFWNNEVLTNIDGVLEKIREAMTPSP